ncbi:hypothetical protein [Acinetobacter guillouiae]|uniref:hypothetical protein n=1 Tax=Acinetobacter guillouiae TaxID=106649 RepID=UPI002FDA60FF
MSAKSELLIGCNGRGVQDSGLNRPISLDEPSIAEQFRLVKAAQYFNFFDRMPLPDQVDLFKSLIEQYQLPVHTTSWLYEVGTDDARLKQNFELSKQVGATTHNMMVYAHNQDGKRLSDQDVIDYYLYAYDEGMKQGIEPSFELHVNMWSEDPRRITPVAQAVKARGIPFNFTLDYSHVIFKIGNEAELAVSNILEDVQQRKIILDPFEKGNMVEEWLEQDIIRWLQIRSVAPNGPRNIWAPHDPFETKALLPKRPSFAVEQGDPGRGILYPFTKPAPGEWHSDWYAHLLEPCKEVVRKVLANHKSNPNSRLRYITTEMITLPDYGLNAKFSLIGQNAEIAKFTQNTWQHLNT